MLYIYRGGGALTELEGGKAGGGAFLVLWQAFDLFTLDNNNYIKT